MDFAPKIIVEKPTKGKKKSKKGRKRVVKDTWSDEQSLWNGTDHDDMISCYSVMQNDFSKSPRQLPLASPRFNPDPTQLAKIFEDN